MTDGGNIERIDHEDGVYWEYEYDGRNRLISADRVQSANIVGEYDYTYDDGDNMLTRSEPFFDDFNDGAYTGWTVGSGTWSASGNCLSATVAAAQNDSIWKNDFTDDNHESRFSYRRTSSGSSEHLYFYARYVDGNNCVRIDLKGDGTARILQNSVGTLTDLDTNSSVPVSTNTWYDVRAVADGATVKVYRKTGASLETEILSTASAAVTASGKMGFSTTFYAQYDIDNVWLIGPSLSNTTTFAVNNANELSTTTDPNGTTAFAFDGWGRMTSKSRGSYAATYGYKYGQMLCSVTSNWPGEGNVIYDYGGNFQRRERTANNATTKYNWTGYFVQSEEDGTGTLTRSFYGGGQVEGVNPGTGTYADYTLDHLGSIRAQYDGNADQTAGAEFNPYGAPYTTHGVLAHSEYAMLAADVNGVYSTLFRYYAPEIGRWMTRDPLGMVDGTNLYMSVGNNPIAYVDPYGLLTLDIVAAGVFGFWDERFRGCSFTSALVSGALGSGVAAFPGPAGFFSGGAGGWAASWLRGNDKEKQFTDALLGSVANGALGTVGDSLEGAGTLMSPLNPIGGGALVVGGALIGGAGAAIATSSIDALNPKGNYYGNCLIK